MSFIRQQTSIAGAPLAWREAGAGPPLLFLHGAGGADSALPFLLPLTARFRVLVPDHPGFGASGEPPWLRDIHDLAYAYLDFLEALQLDAVHLLGTSLGGWVALEIAIRDCARLASMTLVAAAGIPPGEIPIGDLFAWSDAERVRQLVASPDFAARILALPQSAEQAALARRNDAAARRLSGEPPFVDPGLETWLRRIRVPTLVVWGEADRLFPVAYGRKLATLIPGARLALLPACGHLPQVEQPDELAALFEAHVAGTSA